MRGLDRVGIRPIATVVLGSALAIASLPAIAIAAGEDVAALPRCAGLVTGRTADADLAPLWQTELDEDGAVAGHRLAFTQAGRERLLRTGWRGFMVPVGSDRMLIGERFAGGTRLDMIDIAGTCRMWTRQLDRLLYPDVERGAGQLRLTVHDRDSRRYEGTQVLDPETGDTQVVLDATCLEACLPNDGGISIAELQPAGAPRPTPNFSAGGWTKDKALPYRWKAGAVPPSWAQGPLQSGADDARLTSASRSPVFSYSSGSPNGVAYTGSLPGFCGSSAIACASRDMPTDWGVWIRPHGTDFAWGQLLWCQKTSSTSGCFDIRRVMLHELGHVTGLNHPSSEGFTLSVADSVMQGITPMRPSEGASNHAFGRCDVATLQELYDTPDNQTNVSTCNDVATTLDLSASRSSVPRGAAVSLTARLAIAGRDDYRQLAGNVLNGRSVRLEYRRAGSGDAWKTAWMRSLYSGGTYEATITPGATWAFRAVFPTPAGEGLRSSSSSTLQVKVTG